MFSVEVEISFTTNFIIKLVQSTLKGNDDQDFFSKFSTKRSERCNFEVVKIKIKMIKYGKQFRK